MGKETDPTHATCAILAESGPILCWMKPALKNSMSIFTQVPTPTSPLAKLWTWHTTIMKLPWVPSPSILTWMYKRTLSPIMGICSGARPDLKRVHSELISGINAVLDVRKRWVNWVFFLLRHGRHMDITEPGSKWW